MDRQKHQQYRFRYIDDTIQIFKNDESAGEFKIDIRKEFTIVKSGGDENFNFLYVKFEKHEYFKIGDVRYLGKKHPKYMLLFYSKIRDYLLYGFLESDYFELIEFDRVPFDYQVIFENEKERMRQHLLDNKQRNSKNFNLKYLENEGKI